MNRRLLLQSIGALPLANAFAEEKLPPIRRITRGPKFHWFGYYDKWQLDPSGRYVLGCQVDFEHRSPRPDDKLRVGMVDLKDNDRWTELGETRAWNWQQSCMLQFVPGSSTDVIWNDRVKGDGEERFAAVIMNIRSGKRRMLDGPVYALSPDGRSAVAPDFRRLNDCRLGYGYAGIADPNGQDRSPDKSGIWRLDLKTGKRELLLTFAQMASVSYEDRQRKYADDPAKSKHWFNHLLYSTDGSRFLFLHRWRALDRAGTQPWGLRGFSTRMFTVNAKDGSDAYIVDPNGGTSHFIWRDPSHICAWAWHPSHADRFYLFTDKSRDVQVVAPDVMTVNGHNTYLPGHNNEWILNDTYPDQDRYQHPYLYHIPTNRRFPLGHFHAPPLYTGEWRCDLHPRYSPDGRSVVIDSAHEGAGRQMYLIDISGILDAASRG